MKRLSKYDLYHGSLYATVGFMVGSLIAMPFLISNSVELGEQKAHTQACASQSYAYSQATHHTALAGSAYVDSDYTTAQVEIDNAQNWLDKAEKIECNKP
jgi:hypothetical protein